jgi:hypothetical protein
VNVNVNMYTEKSANKIWNDSFTQFNIMGSLNVSVECEVWAGQGTWVSPCIQLL